MIILKSGQPRTLDRDATVVAMTIDADMEKLPWIVCSLKLNDRRVCEGPLTMINGWRLRIPIVLRSGDTLLFVCEHVVDVGLLSIDDVRSFLLR